MRRVNSSSAAFGRLRIDSPGSTRNQMSIRRQQQLRLASERHGGEDSGGFSPMIGAGYSTEQSPLLAPKHHHRPLQPIRSELELEPSPAIPPLAVWIVPTLCCALAYALYNIFIKKGSSHINPVLGGVILQLVAAVLGCCLLLFLVVSLFCREAQSTFVLPNFLSRICLISCFFLFRSWILSLDQRRRSRSDYI